MIGISRSNDAFIAFYPFQSEQTFALSGQSQDAIMATNQILAQDEILSVQTQKEKGQPGQFSIVLKSNKNWKKILEPGSWCAIYISTGPLDGTETAELDSGLRMVGIIKSVRRNENTEGNGSRTVTFTVSGVDHQAVFNSQVYINGSLLADLPSSTLLALFLATSGGIASSDTGINSGAATAGALTGANAGAPTFMTPDVIVRAFVEFYLGKLPQSVQKLINPSAQLAATSAQNPTVVGRPFLVPDQLSNRLLGQPAPYGLFTRMTTFLLQNNLLGVNVNVPPVSGMSSVWGLMTQQAHLLVNEMYTEILPVNFNGQTRLVPTLVLRSQPYSRNQIDPSSILFLDAVDFEPNPIGSISVPTASFYVSQHIQEADHISLSFGKSDAERFNFFLITPNVQGVDNSISAELVLLGYAKLLLAAKDSAEPDKGFNYLADGPSNSRYGLFPFVQDTNFYFKNGDVITMNAILRDMWDHTYLYENGTLVMRGADNHIPVGTNVIFDQRGWVAHIEGVGHQYSVQADGAKTFRTTLSLTHIQKLDGTAIDEVTTGAAAGVSAGASAGLGVELNSQDTGPQAGPWDRGTAYSGGDNDK